MEKEKEQHLVSLKQNLSLSFLKDAPKKTILSNIEQTLADIKSSIEETGTTKEIIDLYGLCNKLKIVSDGFVKGLQPVLIKELNNKKVTSFNVEYTYSERNTYDYSHDKVWNDLNLKLKEREQFLKGVKGSLITIDPETGEEVILYPPSSKSSDVLTGKF